MKRFIAVLALALPACHQHVLINHHYRTNGYVVVGMYGRWTRDEERKTTTLVVGEGFDQRIYVDLNGDNAVDTVEFQYERYKRGPEGSASLFERADTDFEIARGQYDIDNVDREWRAMSADERARREDYFK